MSKKLKQAIEGATYLIGLTLSVGQVGLAEVSDSFTANPEAVAIGFALMVVSYVFGHYDPDGGDNG